MAKILLVDDHPDVVRLLTMALREDGHELLGCGDGAEALRLVEEERPDLVILDIVMPEPDGLRVLNRIKTDPRLNTIVVVMLSARGEPEDMALGLDVGADFYLSKPFRPADVKSLVTRILERGNPPSMPPTS
jgi:two-component system alkaline phosphatase synthesis response regulator PhoP